MSFLKTNCVIFKVKFCIFLVKYRKRWKKWKKLWPPHAR